MKKYKMKVEKEFNTNKVKSKMPQIPFVINWNDDNYFIIGEDHGKTYLLNIDSGEIFNTHTMSQLEKLLEKKYISLVESTIKVNKI